MGASKMSAKAQPLQRPQTAPAMTVRAPCALEAAEAEHLVNYLEKQARASASVNEAAKLYRWANAVRLDYITHPLFIVRA